MALCELRADRSCFSDFLHANRGKKAKKVKKFEMALSKLEMLLYAKIFQSDLRRREF